VIAITALRSRARHNVADGDRGAIETKGKIMNIRNRVIAAVGLVLVAWPTAGFAEFKPSAELRSACTGDAIRLCSAYLMNMDSVAACLRAKKSETSPRCQAQYDAELQAAAQK